MGIDPDICRVRSTKDICSTFSGSGAPGPRVGAVVDSNMAAWHLVTFNNDGTKILCPRRVGAVAPRPRCLRDGQARMGCRRDSIALIANNQMTFQSYYKMSALQNDPSRTASPTTDR